MVLGSNDEKIRGTIAALPVAIITNNDWAKGMGSSLKAGLNAAKENSDAVLVMVCDMPFVTSQHLNNIIETKASVVASKYEEAAGVPALFRNEIYNELLMIDDHEGAQKIIQRHKSSAVLIPLQAPVDLDTPEDYQKALSAN